MPFAVDDWRPTATHDALRRRAGLVAAVRRFFGERGVLEVETPVLAAAAATDLHLASLATELSGATRRTMWLQTSPELHMKRLLAAGSGPIWQLGKAFRDGEAGRRHNPEFTMLEWYRPGWDHHRLMEEVEALLVAALGAFAQPAEVLTYRNAFALHAGIDPFTASAADLARRAGELDVAADGLGDDREAWLHLIFVSVIEPRLGRGRVSFVHDFPTSQAALARIRGEDPPVAERFEAFVEGVELANGYHELADPGEQHRRFDADLAERGRRGLPVVPADERLLAALAHGFPDCAGVALGFDRLVMLALGATSIAEVIAFPSDRA
jgi:elongation factor P--(R)-beta-lysine ligase